MCASANLTLPDGSPANPGGGLGNKQSMKHASTGALCAAKVASLLFVECNPQAQHTHCTNCQTVGKTAALLRCMLSVSSVEAATLCGGVSCDSSQSGGQGSQHISHRASMMAFSRALLRCSCLGLYLKHAAVHAADA